MTRSTKEWPLVKYGDVVTHIKDRIDREKSGLEYYVGGEHFDNGSIRLNGRGNIKGSVIGPTFRMRFKPGQMLLVSRNPHLRKAALANFEGVCSNTTYVCEAQESVLLPAYLPFIMQSDSFWMYAEKNKLGSTNPYLNWKNFAGYTFPLPQLIEQKRIAEILWAAEHSVTKTEDTLDKSRIINKLLILRYSGGENHEWVEGKIKDFGDVQMGRQRAPKYATGKHMKPYLRVMNVFDDKLDLSDVLEMNFDPRDFKRYRLEKGDILLTEGHASPFNVGRSAMYNDEIEECCYQNTLIRFRPGPKITSEFALICFRSAFYKGVFASVAGRTSICHLGSTRFGNIKIRVPPLEVQKKITKVVSASNVMIKEYTKHIVHVQTLRNSLLNLLVSGEK